MIREVSFERLDRSLFEGRNVIYGAGYNGKLLFEKLTRHNVPIAAFYDDDPTRQGGDEKYCGLNILSRNELLSLDRTTTNILISSMYFAQMSAKASEMGFSRLFIFLEFLLQRDGDIIDFDKYRHDEKYVARLRKLITKFDDAESVKYLETILNSVLEGKALRAIVDCYSDEPQYFPKSIRHLLNGINFLDAGAYTGDTLREMSALGIKPANVYAFEADADNFRKLAAYQFDDIGNIHCENFALWNERTRLALKRSNYIAAVDPNGEEKSVEAITIDEYFSDIPIGFVKTDIEGAERYALAGGMKVLERDRPVLAISIYHSLDDVVDIPEMLMSRLQNYDWFIRKHSSTYSEAILYGVPLERI